MLAGVTRMTISLSVILCEISNDAASLLPLMASIFATRVVGDLFNASLFDAAMALAGYPYLEPEPERRFNAYCAEDIMTAKVVCLSEVDTVERIAHALKTTTHAAFPVVDRGSSRASRYLTGVILRYQLEVMLKKKVFLQGRDSLSMAAQADMRCADKCGLDGVSCANVQSSVLPQTRAPQTLADPPADDADKRPTPAALSKPLAWVAMDGMPVETGSSRCSDPSAHGASLQSCPTVVQNGAEAAQASLNHLPSLAPMPTLPSPRPTSPPSSPPPLSTPHTALSAPPSPPALAPVLVPVPPSQPSAVEAAIPSVECQLAPPSLDEDSRCSSVSSEHGTEVFDLQPQALPPPRAGDSQQCSHSSLPSGSSCRACSNGLELAAISMTDHNTKAASQAPATGRLPLASSQARPPPYPRDPPHREVQLADFVTARSESRKVCNIWRDTRCVEATRYAHVKHPPGDACVHSVYTCIPTAATHRTIHIHARERLRQLIRCMRADSRVRFPLPSDAREC